MTDVERVVAEALCPGDNAHFERGWPCTACIDAARRVIAHWPAIQTAMAKAAP